MELSADDDEFGVLDVLVGSDAGAELCTEDVSGDDAAELSNAVESALLDASVVADEVVDGAASAPSA